jgi:DNA-binding beta-propeller fold protein YncE
VYLVNAAIGVVDEIDASSLAMRRTTRLAATGSALDPLSVLIDALHPVALAKRGLGASGAILSPDGSSIYAIGEAGVWLIDTSSLAARQFTKDGTYSSLALSPDGARLYALGFDDGVIRVIDTRTGATLGSMPKIAWPSELIAVDAG